MTYNETWLVATLTAAFCLVCSALAVAFAPPIYTRTEDARIVLTYHPWHTNYFVAVGIVVGGLVLVPRAGRIVRIFGGIFFGGVAAQLIASLIWVQGLPDYLHFFGSIANAADVCMVISSSVLVAWAGFNFGSLSVKMFNPQ